MFKKKIGSFRRNSISFKKNPNIESNKRRKKSSSKHEPKDIGKSSFQEQNELSQESLTIFLRPNNDKALIHTIEDAIVEDSRKSEKKKCLSIPQKWCSEDQPLTFFQMVALFGKEPVIERVIALSLNSNNQWLRYALMDPIKSSDTCYGFTFFHLLFQTNKEQSIQKMIKLACLNRNQWLREALCAPIDSQSSDWHGYTSFHMAARFLSADVIASILSLSRLTGNDWITSSLQTKSVDFFKLIQSFCPSAVQSEVIKQLCNPGVETSIGVESDKLKLCLQYISLHQKQLDFFEFLKTKKFIKEMDDMEGFAEKRIAQINEQLQQLSQTILLNDCD